MAHSPAFRKLAKLLRQALRLHREEQGLPPAVHKGPTRRSFIKGVAAAAGLGIASRAFPFTMQALAAIGGVSPRIALVGGGLAGLTAAYRLKKAGFTAQIYEASGRIGGRVMSRENPIGGGLVIDLGAELINTDHEDMLALVKDFGITLFNRVEEGEKQGYAAECFYFGGQRIDEAQFARDLMPIAAQIAKDSALLDSDYDTHAPQFDALSAVGYLDKHAGKISAPHVRAILESTIRTEYGTEPGETSALLLIYNLPTVDGEDFEILGSSDEVYSVQGGTETITKALGQELAPQIALNRELTALTQNGASYTLKFADGSMAECDYAVLTLPFPVLRTIPLETELPETLRKFIAEGNLGKNAKLVAGFDAKPWRENKVFSMGAWTDQGHGELWDPAQRQTGSKSGALSFYLGGDQVDDVENKQPKEAVRGFIGAMDEFVPGASAAANGRFLMTNWHKSRLSRGAYSTFKPGQLTAFAEYFWIEGESADDLQEVHAGNLIFAGEHLSDAWPGFMNGAAQTGRMAADFIMRSLAERK